MARKFNRKKLIRRQKKMRMYATGRYYPRKTVAKSPYRSLGSLMYRGIGMPERLFTKLEYIDCINMTSVNTFYAWVFRANSLYDPDYTGTGGQSLYRDQLANVYGAYRVYGCKFDVEFVSSTDLTSTGDLMVCSFPTLDATYGSLTRMVDVLTQPKTKYGIISRYGNVNKKFSTYVKSKDIFSVKDLADLDGASSLIGTSPGSLWYWVIAREPTDQTTANGSCKALVKMTQYVEFYQRKQIGLS